jgi:hypothetical protein
MKTRKFTTFEKYSAALPILELVWLTVESSVLIVIITAFCVSYFQNVL